LCLFKNSFHLPQLSLHITLWCSLKEYYSLNFPIVIVEINTNFDMNIWIHTWCSDSLNVRFSLWALNVHEMKVRSQRCSSNGKYCTSSVQYVLTTAGNIHSIWPEDLMMTFVSMKSLNVTSALQHEHKFICFNVTAKYLHFSNDYIACILYGLLHISLTL